MNHHNVPPNAWLLCLHWVADVMNHTAKRSLGWQPPLQVLADQKVDVSIILCFLFWDVIYVSHYPDKNHKDQVGSDKSDEIRG